MNHLIVVDNPKRWSLHIPDVPIVSARSYLTEAGYGAHPGLKVFNLCRSYRYQTTGYYVSLLAMARGHKPLPSIATIQDMKTLSIARLVADDLDEMIQRCLRKLRSSVFTLSIYFGRNLAKRYDELSSRLFRLFPAPLLRAEFVRERKQWRVQTIRPIAASDVPEAHRPFVVEAASAFFSKNRLPRARRATGRYDLAILINPEEKLPPSNKRALQEFAKAGRRLRFDVDFIEREDFGRIAEYDALFLRETTQVNHHTYRFARRAVTNGLVVIDDPDSIAKCTNKVYLAELLALNDIPIPKTLIVHRDNREEVGGTIGLPCILKLPDSSFSQGVVKVDDETTLQERIEAMLERSDLIIAQAFMPTPFDWRIGLLDRKPLYACKYYMAKRHWQIIRQDARGVHDGDAQAVALQEVPRNVLRTAVRAGRLIGDGLYGVDLKSVDGKAAQRRAYVIEINDNPNIDAGVEDGVLKEALYDRIMQFFLRRIELQRNGRIGEPSSAGTLPGRARVEYAGPQSGGGSVRAQGPLHEMGASW